MKNCTFIYSCGNSLPLSTFPHKCYNWFTTHRSTAKALHSDLQTYKLFLLHGFSCWTIYLRIARLKGHGPYRVPAEKSHAHKCTTWLCLRKCFKKGAKMKLTENGLKGFRIAKLYQQNSGRVNHINFSHNGETLISSSDDESIVIYDCQNSR